MSLNIEKMPSEDHYGTIGRYIVGFIFSIALTVTAYLTVTNHVLDRGPLLVTLMVMAVIQLFVQLVFFLHLDRQKSPWNTLIFAFMVIIVLILGVGSLWIMKNLNYAMSATDASKFLVKDEGIQQ